jgi:hypothetical protein
VIGDTAGKLACAEHLTAAFRSGEGEDVYVYCDDDARVRTAV